MFHARVVWLFVLAFASCGSGCSMNRFAADQAGSIAAASTGYMRGFWDYEIARQGTAAAIMQLEAMHSVTPDNEELTLTLVSTYVGHAFGYVELDMERARAERRFANADRLRTRAELIYQRARDLALGAMRERDAGVDAALKGQPSDMQRYLRKHYAAASEIGPVFWTASAWAATLGMTDALDATIDLPMIRAMIEHVVALDPAYESASGLVLLGGVYAQTPPDFGGDPVKAKQYFERALELTQRKSHVVQLNYAKLYALTVNDRQLFRSLIDEILAPEDRGSGVRLSNKIARMHAELLVQVQPPSSP